MVCIFLYYLNTVKIIMYVGEMDEGKADYQYSVRNHNNIVCDECRDRTGGAKTERV